MSHFYRENATSWLDLREKLESERFNMHWVFRGACRSSNSPDKALVSLKSSLERAYETSGVDRHNLPKIEKEMIRDFRRKYDGSDRQDVETDTLYCLSLMRHYGAPTRLLDWTYSPYVAAYFALEQQGYYSEPEIVVWCLSDTWCYQAAIKVAPEVEKHLPKYRTLHGMWEYDLTVRKQKDHNFRMLFMTDRYKFIYPVNPYHLHPRLAIQQGVFLCPGDIRVSLVDILTDLDDSDQQTSMVELVWKPDKPKDECLDALDALHHMNINRSSLFAGLDGFAESLNYRLRHYHRLAQRTI